MARTETALAYRLLCEHPDWTYEQALATARQMLNEENERRTPMKVYEIWDWDRPEEDGPVAIFDKPDDATEYVASRPAFNLKVIQVEMAETAEF